MRGQRFEPWESAYLVDAWEKGVPTLEVARHIGRSQKSVENHASHMRAKRPLSFISSLNAKAAKRANEVRWGDTMPYKEPEPRPAGYILTEGEIGNLYGRNRYEDSTRALTNYGSMGKLYRPELYLSASSSLHGVGTLHRLRRAG
jgi:hypothetical protein